MERFRVELLHIEALPLRLLDSLSASFESSDRTLREAAEAHRRRLENHLEFIRSHDYSKLLDECDYWMELFNNRHQTRQRLDFNEFLSLAGQIQAYEETYNLLNARFFSLVAVGLFAAGSSRSEIVSFLDGQSWSTRHEVLARWGWIKRHAYLLAERKVLVPAPYSCSLTPRDEAGARDDVEFYQLLSFLHFLRFETGREMLFFDKRETPDFILEDQTGGLVGAEMTQAWTSIAWTREHVAKTETLRFIGRRLQHFDVHVHLETPLWRPLRKRRAEIVEWIVGEVANIGIPTTEVSLQNRDLNLRLKLRPAEGRQGISHGRAGPNKLDTEKQSRAMHVSIQETLRRKVEGPEPAVKPCHLVIYPYHDLGTDLEKVIAEFFQHPTLDVSSHFSEVWLCGETHFVKLA